jgi:hypothetical protein
MPTLSSRGLVVILASLVPAGVAGGDGGSVAVRSWPEVRLISRHQDLSGAEFRRIEERLTGANRATVARILGEPDTVEQVRFEWCQAWNYKVGSRRLSVCFYGKRVLAVAHKPN